MSNIELLIIELLLCYILLLILYKTLKIEGMYLYATIALILSSLMSLKTIDIYNFELNLGIIPYTTIFLSSNIIIQKKGPEEIKKLILVLLSTSVSSFIILYLLSLTSSSNINLFTSASYNNIFLESPRIYFANIVTIIYTLFFNSKLYYYLKKEKNNVFISNIFSSIIIQFLSSTLIPLLAYAITKNLEDIIKMIIIRYIINLIICITGTILIYITNKEKVRK